METMASPLSGKKIIIGITGSIAAYKSAELCRLLVKEGAEVKAVMTTAAFNFITPLTISTLTRQPVLSGLIADDASWNNHVELGLWADLMLIAPASANTIAKCAQGLCDNLLNAVYLSVRCPVMIAPAMDHDMYLHPSTQQNIVQLRKNGNLIIGPVSGELASGLIGEGRMEEPEIILQQVHEFFEAGSQLRGKRILVSAGPTREYIDPVRYISNESSGKMGFAIAKELSKRGAEVTLVAGPNNLEKPSNLHYISVSTSQDMHDECMQAFNESDIGIMSAAVADFSPETSEAQKIKKAAGVNAIRLKPTVDILAEMGKAKKEKQLLVGFALETEDALKNGMDKLHRKNLDLIVVNSLEDEGAGFGGDENKVTLIDKQNNVTRFELKSKAEVARDIVDKIISLYNNA